MPRPPPQTVKELLYWSYACLAMAHSAVTKEQEKYAQINYIIRAKLYKGLMDDKMSVGSIFQDEKIKISQGGICSYCGCAGPLSSRRRMHFVSLRKQMHNMRLGPTPHCRAVASRTARQWAAGQP